MEIPDGDTKPVSSPVLLDNIVDTDRSKVQICHYIAYKRDPFLYLDKISSPNQAWNGAEAIFLCHGYGMIVAVQQTWIQVALQGK